MNKLTIIRGLTLMLALSASAWSFHAVTSASGPGGGYSGAPSDSNCSSCHGSASSNSSALSLSMVTAGGATATDYIPDSTYTVTVTLTGSASRYGFQTTALNASNTMAGSFTITNSTRTQTSSANSRSYVEHTSGGITGSGGSNSWSFQWKAPSTSQGTVTFYVAGNLANGNGVADAGDAIHLKSFSFSVSNKLPTAVITSRSTPVCVGDTISFDGSASTGNVTSYSWAFPQGDPASSTDVSETVRFTGSGTKQVRLTVSNAYGSHTATKNISVAALPDTTVTVTGSPDICVGDSVRLQAPSGSVYLWKTGQATGTIYAKAAGEYYVDVTSANGCKQRSQSVFVTTSPRPTADVDFSAVNDTACLSGPLVITLSNVMGSTITVKNLTTGSNPVFTGTDTIISLPPNTFAFRLGTNEYEIAVGNGTCTEIVALHTITGVLPPNKPNVVCQSSTSNSIAIQWGNVSGATGYQLSADSGQTWVDRNTAAPLTHTFDNLEPSTAYGLQVRTKRNSGQCSVSEAAVIQCQTAGCGAIAFDVSGDTVPCPGTSVELTFNNVSISNPEFGHGDDVTSWSSVNRITVTSADWGNKDTMYPVRVRDANNLPCGYTEHFVHFRPHVDASPVLAGTAWCGAGEPLVLNVADSGLTVVEWFRNGERFDSTNDRRTLIVADHSPDDAYMVRGYGSHVKCVAVSNSFVPVEATPLNAGFTLTGDTMTVAVEDTTAAAAGRMWDWGDGETTLGGGSQATHTYDEEGEYEVTLTVVSAQGCTTTVSQTFIAKRASIAPMQVGQLKIYPNPTRGTLTIEMPQANPQAMLQLIDAQGRTHYAQRAGSQTLPQIDISHLPKGIYILRVVTGQGVYQSAVVKE